MSPAGSSEEVLVALVMSDNREALELFRHAPGRSTLRRSASGHTEMLIELPEPGRLAESRLGHALRSAARGAVTINPWSVISGAIRRRHPG